MKDRSLTCKRAYLYDEVAKISPSDDWLRLAGDLWEYFKGTLEVGSNTVHEAEPVQNKKDH